MTTLPEKFVAEGLALAKDALIFGVRLDLLSRDELLAVAAQGWKLADQRRAEAQRVARVLLASQ